jgi:hypothetical protein
MNTIATKDAQGQAQRGPSGVPQGLRPRTAPLGRQHAERVEPTSVEPAIILSFKLDEAVLHIN